MKGTTVTGREIFAEIANLQDRLEEVHNAIGELRGKNCTSAMEILDDEQSKVQDALNKLLDAKFNLGGNQ